MPGLAIQLYTLRDIDRPLPEIIERVGEVGYDGVEFAHRFTDADVERVAAAMDRGGVEAVGAHVGLHQLEEADDDLFDRYRAVDCSRLVIPHLPEAHFVSQDAITELAERLNDLGAELADEGFSLCYHNQDHDFHPSEEGTAFDTLVAETDPDLVSFEFDVGGAQAAGQDPVAVLERLGARSPLVHVKDVHARNPSPGAGQVSAKVGEGDVDIAGVARAAADAGAEWLVFEDDEPTDPEVTLTAGYDALATARA